MDFMTNYFSEGLFAVESNLLHVHNHYCATWIFCLFVRTGTKNEHFEHDFGLFHVKFIQMANIFHSGHPNSSSHIVTEEECQTYPHDYSPMGTLYHSIHTPENVKPERVSHKLNTNTLARTIPDDDATTLIYHVN